MIQNLWYAVKYFFFYPLFALFPPPFPYRFAGALSRLEYRFSADRRNAVLKGLGYVFADKDLGPSGKDRTVRAYFKMACCDEIDVYIYFSWFSNRFLRRLRIEGLDHLDRVLQKGKGIFLTAHFGGGFWILPFLRDRGVPTSFFSAEIRRTDHPGRFFLYLYQRFRIWAVRRASGKRVLSKGEGKQGILRVLEGGGWVIILLDVPPFRVKDHMEVTFLGKKVLLPRGILSIIKETRSPILPFFSFIHDGELRGIRFEEPICNVEDEEECAKRCAKLIGDRILERPDHWHFWPIVDQFFSSP